MKQYKATVKMTGKKYKQFIKGVEDLDDDKKYILIFYAESIKDCFKFYWGIFRKHKATIIRESR